MNDAILRLPDARKPYSRSAFYERIRGGLMVRPVRLSARAVGWPAQEIERITRAVIAGCSDDEIRHLVGQLHAERKNLAPTPDRSVAGPLDGDHPGAQVDATKRDGSGK